MRCGHCKRDDTGVTVNHVRACGLIRAGAEWTPEIDRAMKAEPAKAPVTEEGFYLVPSSGEYVKVLRSESSGHLYTKVWEPAAGGEGRGGHWDYTAGLLRLMTADMRITAEQAREFGVLYSCCVFCSRKLTRDESIAVGYGPDCAEREGLPWG